MRILVAEDETLLAEQLAQSLKAEGYAVDVVHTGTDAHHLGATESYDAVLLDLGLPEIDGISILQRWRAEGHAVPVLILSARQRWTERVQGIDAGADDYIAKPFEMAEVLARVRAVIRRSVGHAAAVLACGAVELDTRTGRVTDRGQPVKLTAQELRILSYLMHHAGRIVSRSELIEHVYDRDFDRDSNLIEVFIGRLRKKLPSAAIETVRGMGYRLIKP